MKPGSYIAIEGPIGVGKSTLAAALAQSFAAAVLAEAPEDNPFLGDFYANPRGHALQAQLFFLLQRSHQIDRLRQRDLFDSGCVADFMFDKDSLFAELTLTAAELTLYRDIHARVAWRAPVPDCVIYLHAPVDLLMQRIEQRARASERNLDAAYLARVTQAYADFFRAYDATRVIRVDAQRLDLVNRPADYARLLAAIDCGRRRIELPA